MPNFTESHAIQNPAIPLIPGVRNVIAVGSGKGGVGKSTVSTNLAFALLAAGGRVGILDADIHGPNQPLMLGVNESFPMKKEGGLQPIVQHRLQTISMGYLVDPKTPVIWRGPMISQAVQQFCYETKWDNLDYLIIDLPPGTGDIQLTLCQKIPVTAALIVTTPQAVSTADAAKALQMFQKMQIKVLGVIENMSGHVCSHCGHHENIFGEGGGVLLTKESNVDFLGSIPLESVVRECSDQGYPLVIAKPTHPISVIYQEISQMVINQINALPKNYASKMPPIVVERKKN